MNPSNPWADRNGSIQACRSSTTGLARATSMNSAMEDSEASGMLVTRTGKPSAISWAWSHLPSA